MSGKLILCSLIAVCFAMSQEGARSGVVPPSKNVFVIGYRTAAHVRASSPDVFHQAMADVRRLLTDHKVAIVKDPERGWIENESPMSIENMTKLAKEAGADSLLLLTVDRPASKWIKVTVDAYDLKGIHLWQENVDSGMSPMNGTSGYKKCFEKLGKTLPARIGGPGLPVSDEVAAEKKS